MRDTLPKKVRKNESGVVNLDTSAGKGTHWVCYMKKGDTAHYYDSFAVPPPLEISRYLGIHSRIFYNAEQEQQIKQVICGHLCLQFLVNGNGER